MQSRTVSAAEERTSRTGERDGEQEHSYDKHTTVHEETDDTEEDTVELQPSEAGSYASTVVREVPKPYLDMNDTTNTISPVKPKLDFIRKHVLPDSFADRNRFERCKLKDSFDEKEWDSKYRSRHESA